MAHTSPKHMHAYFPLGHDAAVYSSSWSHDGRWLVTCSADQTARLWAQGRQEPLLVFNSTQHNFKSDKHLTTSDKVCGKVMGGRVYGEGRESEVMRRRGR